MFYDCQWFEESVVDGIQKLCEGNINQTSQVIVVGEGLNYFRKQIMEAIAKTGCCNVLEEGNK